MRVEEAEVEFESLPPVLRRKYFSTLERLRLASTADPPFPSVLPRSSHGRVETSQRHPFLQRSKSSLLISGKKPLSGPLGSKRLKPLLWRHSPTLGRRTIGRLQKSSVAKDAYIASQVDAQWFLSLPPAIQRKKFTREEQFLFAGIQDTVILDAADEKIYNLRKHAQQSSYSLDSLFSLYDHSIVSADSDDISSSQSEGDMDERYTCEGFRWLEDDGELDLSLDDYHTALTETIESDNTPPTRKRRPSFRRTLSISSFTFGRSSTSQNPPRTSDSSTTPSALSQKKDAFRPYSTILVPRYDPQKSLVTTKDQPSATHYQDPEARLKLRVYLASPQKFDEAIEFGFPSLANENIPSTSETGRAPKHTFLDDPDDEISPLFDNADNSEAESNGPNTPVDSAIGTCSKTSKDGNSLVLKSPQSPSGSRTRPYVVKHSDTYIHSPTGNREMTLRMTLTRPDLRTTDEITKPANNADADALKLADLALNDDNSPLWASMPPSEKKAGVKGMWKKFKGGNRS